MCPAGDPYPTTFFQSTQRHNGENNSKELGLQNLMEAKVFVMKVNMLEGKLVKQQQQVKTR